jgi:hypothetical protein
MATKTIKGMDELIRKIDTVTKMKGAKRGLKAGAEHIEGTIKEYPRKTMANNPDNPTGRWYERGYGPRWKRKRKQGIGGRKTSETLRAQWSTKSRAGGLQQVIGNSASYSKYVHSEEDQAGFHGDRGWKTDEQVLDSEGDKVLNFIKHEIEKELSG